MITSIKEILSRAGRPRFLVLLGVFAATLAMALPTLAVAYTPGAPLSSPFPRLGMWWPDLSRQPMDQIARYDFITVLDWQRGYIPAVRAANPGMIILGSATACEFRLAAGSENGMDIAEIPASWLLTQIGSTLTADIDATTRTLPLASVNATKFVVGDVVVIGNEMCKVVSVGASTITVDRGAVRGHGAAPHARGARVASTMTIWPGSAIADLSSNCPRVDIGHGLETFRDYNVRVTAALFASGDYDGLLIDRSNGNESRLIPQTLMRTIDPARSNVPVTDGYAAFDAAFNAGLVSYLQSVRAAIGQEHLIYGNFAYPSYDSFNGTNFEGAPADEGGASGLTWHALVFGPVPTRGSYLDWLTLSRQPNLTSLMTYEDDRAPSATGGGTYVNPVLQPGFVPNYRKMRFGLCTALMGDGFFIYEVNTNGAGHLGLLWFDEFDGAGLGRGYLGAALGPATSTVTMSGDLLSGDGAFDTSTQLSRWYLWRNSSSDANVALDSATARVTVSSQAQEEPSFMHPVSVAAGKPYTLSFRARADRVMDVSAWIQRYGSSTTYGVFSHSIPLDTQWRTYELPCTASGTDAAASLRFGLRDSAATVWLDDVKLRPGSRDVMRRDFEHGIILVNATDAAANVPLGGVFRKLPGVQVPSLNDGSLVSAVTVPAKDGLVLLRADSNVQATSISIGSSTSSVYLPRPFVLSGVLTPGKLKDPCITEVKKPESARWSYSSARLAYATTSSGGANWWYRYTPKLRGVYYFRVRFTGDATRLGSLSRTIAVRVR